MLRLAMIAVSILLLACKSEAKKAPGSGSAATAPLVVNTEVERAKKAIADGAIVVDVRTLAEVKGGYRPGAVIIPLDLMQEKLPVLDALTKGDKAKPIVVHCATGERAEKAKAQLEAAGYTNVINGGGYDDLR